MCIIKIHLFSLLPFVLDTLYNYDCNSNFVRKLLILKKHNYDVLFFEKNNNSEIGIILKTNVNNFVP